MNSELLAKLRQYARACVARVVDEDALTLPQKTWLETGFGDPEIVANEYDRSIPLSLRLAVKCHQPIERHSITGQRLPDLDIVQLSWSASVHAAREYSLQGAGREQRYKAEVNRQQKIAAKLGLRFDCDEAIASSDTENIRQRLLETVPHAINAASARKAGSND